MILKKLKSVVKFIIHGSSLEELVYESSSIGRNGFVNKVRLENIKRKIQSKYASNISSRCQFGSNLMFKHPIGIVIGDGVKIGSNVTIYQNVTIGARRLGEGKVNLYPTLGNNITVYTGAVILGNVKIGNDCIIAANAVVLKDMPAGTIAKGVPAIISCNRNIISS
ncbi:MULTISPECIES: serine O-acetyltransferase [unclassified Vibrio]|uniref:serine O-acetyltransferase n=1 Tax=unclassified Vibrio TaxID=2614977 RepID=UPI00354FCD94